MFQCIISLKGLLTMVVSRARCMECDGYLRRKSERGVHLMCCQLEWRSPGTQDETSHNRFRASRYTTQEYGKLFDKTIHMSKSPGIQTKKFVRSCNLKIHVHYN